ncbi:RepB family plasmid replication initiator protein [Aerococcus viridans]
MKNKKITQYKNEINTIPMRKWTTEEMNFFFAVLTKMRDEGNREIHMNKFDLADLAKSSIDHNQQFYTTINSLSQKINTLTYREYINSDGKHSLLVMPLFTYFKAEWEDDLSDMNLKIKVNEEWEYILNGWQEGNWTKFMLNEFLEIKSTYSKTLFRLLKQWKNVGKREFSLGEFRQLMSIPDSYTSGHINNRIIQNSVKELSSSFQNLKVKIIKSNKRGHPVTGYLFTWQPEHTEPWLENKYDEQPQEYAPKYEDKFTEWLINYGVLSTYDPELIEQFKLEVYPLYQQIADRSTLDNVAKHISYVAHKKYTHPVGYFKKAAKEYLDRFI